MEWPCGSNELTYIIEIIVTFKFSYVNIQYNHVNMRLIHNKMKHNYDNVQLKLCCMLANLCEMFKEIICMHVYYVVW